MRWGAFWWREGQGCVLGESPPACGWAWLWTLLPPRQAVPAEREVVAHPKHGLGDFVVSCSTAVTIGTGCPACRGWGFAPVCPEGEGTGHGGVFTYRIKCPKT